VFDETLIARAREMVPLLAAREVATNASREVSEETIDTFRSAGFFRVLQPRRFGGLQGSFGTFSRIVEELAMGCSSSAWVYAVLGEHQWIIACFPERAQEDVWQCEPAAVASSSLVPRAEASAVPGGWLLSGKFPFSSGSRHAQWAIIGAFAAAAGGTRHVRYNLIPMSDLQRMDDWQVLGLRGTGSQSLLAKDVFVPEYRSVALDALNSGDTPGRSVHPDYPLLAAPRDYLVPFSLPPVMFSLARRAFDLVVPMLREKVMRASLRAAESETIQIRLAETAAAIDAAQRTLNSGRAHAVARVESRVPITMEERLRARRDIVYAQQTLRRSVETICDMAGTHWVYDASPLQAILRDVLTISTHSVANPLLAMAPYGRHLLGVESTA
jgi:3-hydroxy-9,10-secoandrosta-1,3,5(10)-triene-9,17-dione monooxygenase